MQLWVISLKNKSLMCMTKDYNRLNCIFVGNQTRKRMKNAHGLDVALDIISSSSYISRGKQGKKWCKIISPRNAKKWTRHGIISWLTACGILIESLSALEKITKNWKFTSDSTVSLICMSETVFKKRSSEKKDFMFVCHLNV